MNFVCLRSVGPRDRSQAIQICDGSMGATSYQQSVTTQEKPDLEF